MVNPFKIFLFTLSVLLILLIVSLVIPEDGIHIGKNATIRFVTFHDLIHPKSQDYADISNILEYYNPTTDTTELSEELPSEVEFQTPIDTVKADAELLKKNLNPIQIPADNPGLLYPFFKQLDQLKDTSLNEVVRILHYGDSQIEGDRITSYIRNKLQRQFGGTGAGLIPIVQPYGQFSIKQKISDNWIRYTIFGKRDSNILHNRYGALASFCRFSPYKEDSAKTKSSEEAWIILEKSEKSYWNTKVFNQLKMFYGYNTQPFIAEIYQDDILLDAEMIPPLNDINYLEWSFSRTPDQITIKLSGSDSPDVYAIAIDNHRGIAVDNIPMRGSAGLVFSKMDPNMLKKMYNLLNVKLFILQFGGNVVPYISENVKYYEKWFYNQLSVIKKIQPGVPVIVIGVADMSINENGKYVTHPYVEKVRDALKNATFKAGFAYWDMYEAMGGYNSMPSWVFADPSLASTDFIHFNHRGARLIAEMFYKAFIFEYKTYAKNSEN